MRKVIGLLVIGLMLLFAGCESSSSSGAKTSSYSLDGAFNGGDDALTAEFTEGQPPEKIRDGGLQPFTIRALITNVGEYDIPEGEAHVAISGVSPDDFGIDDASQDLPALRGVKQQGENTIDGSVQPVIYSNLKYVPQLPSGTHTQTIYMDICYPYQTTSLISMCVSGSTLQSFDNDLKVCEIEGDRSYANSGAPVIIENVKQSPAGGSSVMIQFDIVHQSSDSSNGRVYKSGSLDNNCKVNGKAVTSTDAVVYENYVKYTVETGLDDLDCSGTGTNAGEVLLAGDKTTVYCTQDTTDEEDYERPVTVTLEYDYFDRIDTQVQIEHISQ